MSRHEEIKNAYRNLGGEATFYDGMITCSTLPGKAVCKLIWNMNKKENDRYLGLAPSGVYALVRNPIYSAFLSVCTGTLMIYGNLWLLILPVLYWLFLTVLMKCTEEKWVKNLYGAEYDEYCRRVNRCIPCFLGKHH